MKIQGEIIKSLNIHRDQLFSFKPYLNERLASPRNYMSVQVVSVSNVSKAFKSLHWNFISENLKESNFFQVESAPIHLMNGDLLETYEIHI